MIASTRNRGRWLGLVIAAAAAVSCARADCNENWIGDGDCDLLNNSEECSYDGGDCCECTCEDDRYSCQDSNFACIDPEASCSEDKCILSGDSICDPQNNNEECGEDQGNPDGIGVRPKKP